MIKYLLDSCFLIEFYKRNTATVAIINELQIEIEQCAISSINRMEILGFSNLSQSDEKGLKALLENFQMLTISPEIEDETIYLRKHQKIKLPDAIVLATANVHNLQLITFDQKLQKKFANS